MDIFVSVRDPNCIKFLRLFVQIKDKLQKYNVPVVIAQIESLNPRKIQCIEKHIKEGLPFATVVNPKTNRQQIIKNPKQIYEVLLDIYNGRKRLMREKREPKIKKNLFYDGIEMVEYEGVKSATEQDFEEPLDDALSTAMASKMAGARKDYTPSKERVTPDQAENMLDSLATKKWEETDHDYVDVSDFTQSIIESGELDTFRGNNNDGQFTAGMRTSKYQDDRYADYRRNFDEYAGY